MTAGHEHRARPLVVLDVDSTLIEQEVIELIAAHAGTEAEVAEVTERAMRGELDFAESLRARVSTLAGVSTSLVAAVADSVTLSAGAAELIDAVHARGGWVCAVSGGFHEVLDPLAERIGLDRWRANRLAATDGRLTGLVDGPIIDAAAKAAALREWGAELGTPLSAAVAIGDGANDLAMINAAGCGVAFCAKPAVRIAADVVLDTRDLAQVIALLP